MKWTNEANNYLRVHSGTKSRKELSEKFGVTEGSIKSQLHRLGLRKVRKLKTDIKAKDLLKEQIMCAPVKVPTCAPQVITHNGRRLEYWGKNIEAFKQRLSK